MKITDIKQLGKMAEMNTSISNFENVRVLITGGLGFIGSALARRLVGLGAKVTIMDSLIPEYGGNLFNIDSIKDRVRVNISDVRDKYAMAYLIKEQDYLFNLAGQTSHLDSMEDPHTDLEINAASQLSILEACKRNNPGIKVVFSSTRQLYGCPEYLPVDEKHPTKPVDVNGINKLAGENYHMLYNNVHNIRTCVLRLTNTYGPGMRIKDARQTFLGIWIKSLIDNQPIKVFGDGMQLRDFTYVDDAVDALLLSAANDKSSGQIFNLGGNETINLRDLAECCIKAAGKGTYDIIPFPEDRQAIDIGDYFSDYSKIQTMLGWEPKIDLKNGLEASFFYYQVHFKKYV